MINILIFGFIGLLAVVGFIAMIASSEDDLIEELGIATVQMSENIMGEVRLLGSEEYIKAYSQSGFIRAFEKIKVVEELDDGTVIVQTMEGNNK